MERLSVADTIKSNTYYQEATFSSLVESISNGECGTADGVAAGETCGPLTKGVQLSREER
jgi:hypothetical protein